MSLTNEIAQPAKKRALICGISGQDGTYLAEFLISKGYEVIGTSRDASTMRRDGLKMLGLEEQLQLVSMVPSDFRSVLHTITRLLPNEIYNLSGQTSVGLSFEQPVETIESISIGTLNILEAMRFADKPIRFYNAGSSECFGNTGSTPASEATPFNPRSPYAVAKACAHNLISNYRDAYNLHACTGILFNHESPLRPERFVTQKIVYAAARIARGSRETLRLGNLEIYRDWGWAPEYVQVMWSMLQADQPHDFVIATGRTVSLEYFVEHAFAHFNLNWRQHVKCDKGLLRPSDVRFSASNPALSAEKLSWKARHDVDDVIDGMCRAAKAN